MSITFLGRSSKEQLNNLWCSSFSRLLRAYLKSFLKCVFAATCTFLELQRAGLLSSCGTPVRPLLWSPGARVRWLHSCDPRAPEHRLNSRGAQVYLLSGRWDLPGPGIEPMSPDLAGKFFTTEPLGKSKSLLKIVLMKVI